MGLYKITPEYLTEYVNFHFTDRGWHYDRDEEENIAKLQAEGSAKAYNLLTEHKIALLADEVGMGKTYEALAVMITLWRQKPDARVLLYAPNEIVARKWIKDYHNFIRNNYRETNDLVTSSLNHRPLREAVYCHNHIALMENINKQWISFFVCKTSSLSGFLSPLMNNETFDRLHLDIRLEITDQSSSAEVGRWLYKLGNRCRERVYEVLSKEGRPPFDLLIFDEAHYLRNTHRKSNSLRSITAHAFFAGREILSHDKDPYAYAPGYTDYRPLAERVLLMTATPNHSDNTNVIHIVSLFRPEYHTALPREILSKICVRRFRRLANKVKYQYREEIPEKVKISSLQEKLFFAAYHKSLVLYKARQKKEKGLTGNNAYRVLYGYLEGFEFFTNDNREKHAEHRESQERSTDFEESDDTAVIRELSDTYQKIYRTNPAHPKYERIIRDLSPANLQGKLYDKKLVFVRRIPSVNEIAHRLMKEYEEIYKVAFRKIVGVKRMNRLRDLRKYFFNLGRDNDLVEEEILPANETEEEELKGIPKSGIMDLFTVKKEGKYRTTDCSNFRIRFIKNEHIFSLFFQPAADYKDSPYTFNGFITKTRNNKTRRLYRNTAQKIRLEGILRDDIKIILGHVFDAGTSLNKLEENIKTDTLMGIWMRTNHEDPEINEAKNRYLDFSIYEKEGFSNYLEAGILFSSRYIIDFYLYYHYLRHLKGMRLYQKFCEKVENELTGSGLDRLIAEAVTSFRDFYEKEMGFRNGQELVHERWTFLKSTIPVYPFNGATKRDSIVKAFNTPFYPDVLISTSVLQEGVDLHHHCSEIIHYGIAWTQGDNEQRIGRVDRLFGKLNKKLEKEPAATLPIRYPFLANTLDEDQLKRFIRRKYISEKLLDKLNYLESGKEIELREMPDENWEEYFNKPQKDVTITEPFKVTPDDFDGIMRHAIPQHPTGTLELKKALSRVFHSLIDHYKEEVLYYQYEKNREASPLIFAIKHIRKNGRHQPVLIELDYYEPGLSYLGKPVYYLKIKTPLCSNRCIHDLVFSDVLQKIYWANPVLKINYSPKTRGFFRMYVSTELSLFSVDEENENINISEGELITTIRNVIAFTDDLENHMYQGKVDVGSDKIINDNEATDPDLHYNDRLTMDRVPLTINPEWEENKGSPYLVKRSSCNITATDEIVYVFNHQNPFVRMIKKNDHIFKEVGLYKNDALQEELDLLKKVIYGHYT